jgi:hypothetical protein
MTARVPREGNPPALEPFVGAWDLVSISTEWPDGRVTKVWGDHPVGRLTYGADGRMSALLMDGRRNQADGRDVPPEFQASAAGYFGTFTVDSNRRVVSHHVAASIRATESGTLERAYEFRDDHLALRAVGTIDGMQVTSTLVWKRAAL